MHKFEVSINKVNGTTRLTFATIAEVKSLLNGVNDVESLFVYHWLGDRYAIIHRFPKLDNKWGTINAIDEKLLTKFKKSSYAKLS
jgi:hypothetical protein